MDWRYWLFVTLTLVLTAALGVATVATTRLLRTWRPQHNPLLLPGEVLMRLALVAVCVGLGWLSGRPFAALGWTLDYWPVWLVLGVVLGAALGAAFFFATRWVVARTGHRFYSPILTEILAPRDGVELAWMALAFVPAVALEELLFRSLWIGGFSVMAPAGLWLLASALIFGLLHGAQGLWGMAGATLAGLILGLLFLASGSLVLPLAAHWVVNVIQVAALLPRKP